MRVDERLSLASARRAAEEGRLAEWVIEFLASAGSDNEVLAGALAFEGTAFLGPVRLDLDELVPMAGPDEEQVVVPIDEDEWEDDVETMQDSLVEGWEPPPVLVSARDGAFFIEDGNHRHEVLRRAGAADVWAIVLFPDQAQRARFVLDHDLELPSDG